MLCALPLLAGADEGLKLKPQSGLLLIPPDNDDVVPLFIEADRIQGTQDKELEAFGNARLRKRGHAFYADWMRHDTPTDVLTAKGNVHLEQDREVIDGDALRYELGTERGYMDRPRYKLMVTPETGPITGGRAPIGQTDGRGTAEKLLFEGPGQYRVETASYTTCEPGNDAWYLNAKQLDIDRNRDVGTARDASIVFFDVPIFYSPYLSFSLHEERKSGLLTPSYRTSNTTGFEFTTPFYWNIAPEMDATLFPRYMTKRGLQLGGEFRYLDSLYAGGRGEVRAELLSNDQQIGRDRWGLFTKHQQSLGYGWNSTLNLNRVSDGKYFTDLSTQVAVTSQVYLSNDITFSRSGIWGDGGTYGVSAFAQRWQTLQADPLVPLTGPYNREPQLTLTAQRLTSYGDFDMLGSFTSFAHPSLVNGKRTVVNPSFSMPLQNAYAYVTPKVGAHFSYYAIGDNNTTGLPDATRSLPTFSVDSGVVFERETQARGQALIQTLEPKAYYVYIPYKDQSQLPNFESGLQDINFATIYTENQFSGQDRINDANQLTLGLSTRFIDAQSGIERLRAAVAQRYYFQSQRVTVPGVAPRASDSNSSDLLAAISGNIAKNWTGDAGWQYNTDLKQTQKFNIAARYQPQIGKVVNFAYRETVNSVQQVDISTQWPIDGRWTAVGRWNFSIRDDRTLEALAGFEYSDRCWALRIAGHRFATTTASASTSIFIQLELSGMSRIGTSPLEVLRRNISGYKQLDPRSNSPVEYNVPGLF